MPDRDRDPQGRARNARPRDGLGRPLPHGAAGVARIDETVVLPPAESLAVAQRLLDDDRPFHAHEVLEAAWKSGPAAERDLWKGLAQLAVGLTHVRRGNAPGAISLLRRAGDHLAPYAERTPHEIAAAELATYAWTLADRIEHSGLSAVDRAGTRPRLSASSSAR